MTAIEKIKEILTCPRFKNRPEFISSDFTQELRATMSMDDWDWLVGSLYEVLASLEAEQKPVCKKCGGNGRLDLSCTSEGVGRTVPCPDCQKPEFEGEHIANAMFGTTINSQEEQLNALADRRKRDIATMKLQAEQIAKLQAEIKILLYNENAGEK
jgi:hypothetical protein